MQTRRQFIAGAALGAGALASRAWGAPQSRAVFGVDFGRIAGRTDAGDLGFCCSTYGPTPIDLPLQAEAERRLDTRLVRVPLTIKNGSVDSGADGKAAGFNMGRLVDWYRENGFSVYATLGGRTNDLDYRAGDATLVARRLGFERIEYGSINEPNNHGMKVEGVVEVARQTLADLRRVDARARLWGPEWAWFAPADLKRFAKEMGEGLAGVSFHHYAMGVESLSTAKAMAMTPDWGREVAQVRADLRELGLPERVGVTELNLSWRYTDGTAPDGKNRRFYSAPETAWVASTCGHILRNGGRALVYGSQNGAMGVWNQNPNPETDEIKRPQSSPLPAHWGLAAWTGAHLWPHFSDRFWEVSAPNDEREVEVFAVANERRGANLVLINKGDQARTVEVAMRGQVPGRRLQIWASDPQKPFDAPCSRPSVSLRDGWRIDLPPFSIAVAVIS